LKKKAIVVVGATASGKTALGVHIAQNFNGEVILDKAFVWEAPDGFKFVFEDDKLISINHI
jgi:shikimate kinase